LVRQKDPKGYQDLLSILKSRIRAAQVRAALAVNQELVLLNWGIGKEILTRQREDGWGTRVIARLARDLPAEFPEMQVSPPRNLGYMKAFAEAWPEESILQVALAKITWYHNLTLLERVKSSEERLWYAEQTVANGCTFRAFSWNSGSDLHSSETSIRSRSQVTITRSTCSLILCKSKKQLVVESALRNTTTPMGIAEYRYLEKLPDRLKGTLPAIEEIEAELGTAAE